MVGLPLAAGRFAMGNTKIRRKLSTNLVSTIYRSVNGTSEENMNKIVEMLGGTGKITGPDDVVVIKPNVQWWNQGAPNLAVLKRFVEIIMNRPGGFDGELVIAENCHRGPTPWLSKSSGWAQHFERNSDIPQINNFTDLTGSLKKKYGEKFTIRHWIDIESGAKQVYGPKDGEGYVYCDGNGDMPLLSCNNGMTGEKAQTTIMTYPIFKTDKGTIVDFNRS